MLGPCLQATIIIDHAGGTGGCFGYRHPQRGLVSLTEGHVLFSLLASVIGSICAVSIGGIFIQKSEYLSKFVGSYQRLDPLLSPRNVHRDPDIWVFSLQKPASVQPTPFVHDVTNHGVMSGHPATTTLPLPLPPAISAAQSLVNPTPSIPTGPVPPTHPSPPSVRGPNTLACLLACLRSQQARSNIPQIHQDRHSRWRGMCYVPGTLTYFCRGSVMDPALLERIGWVGEVVRVVLMCGVRLGGWVVVVEG